MSSASPQLRGLLAATQALRSGTDLPEMLEAVAAAIGRSLGFATVAINLYRPAWHDYQAVVVHGSHQARDALMHTTTSVDSWTPLMDERFRRGSAFFVPAGNFDWSRQVEVTYIPDIDPPADPNAWLAEDALFVPFHSGDGEIQGMLSVDEPTSGLRPTPEDLETLAAVAAQAALAIESAQRAEDASQRRATAEHLLRVSAYLARERSVNDMLDVVCTGISEALGFDKVIVFLRERERGSLSPVASAGWSPMEIAGLPEVELTDMSRLLRPELEQDGCLLLDRDTAHAMTRMGLHDIYSSWANGRGPHAWCHHWLLVALRDRGGGLLGFISADDPRDRLRPTQDRLQILRTFANQVTSALESTRHMERLRYMAEHDPLTGLRNRRGLRPRADDLISTAPDAVALIVCDIDGFKRINDVLGYETGDSVLRAVANTLRAACPPDGLAVRLGGEDFALIVPAIDADVALAVAEELRRAVTAAMTMVPWDVTLSAGVSITGQRTADAASLLRAGTRALFAAKRLGRDRTVVYSAETLEVLLGTLEDSSGSEQLAAMILLAETLDMRDPHTARHSQTVGLHAEQLARALGWPPERVERVCVAGVLHDIGKLGLPDAILHKAGPLDAREWGEIQRHPEMGARILDHANLRDIAAWVLCHHERIDGLGYPRRLAGDDIPIEARILAVADAYEAMTADRPYRQALPRAAAIEELLRQRGSQFDAEVVDVFIDVIARCDEAGATL